MQPTEALKSQADSLTLTNRTKGEPDFFLFFSIFKHSKICSSLPLSQRHYEELRRICVDYADTHIARADVCVCGQPAEELWLKEYRT